MAKSKPQLIDADYGGAFLARKCEEYLNGQKEDNE